MRADLSEEAGHAPRVLACSLSDGRGARVPQLASLAGGVSQPAARRAGVAERGLTKCGREKSFLHSLLTHVSLSGGRPPGMGFLSHGRATSVSCKGQNANTHKCNKQKRKWLGPRDGGPEPSPRCSRRRGPRSGVGGRPLPSLSGSARVVLEGSVVQRDRCRQPSSWVQGQGVGTKWPCCRPRKGLRGHLCGRVPVPKLTLTASSV